MIINKISIFIPAYNAEKTIERTIDGILNQTYTHFELIIVNDGSTDGTEEIIKRYAEKDSRIRLISQPNRGRCYAANTAIKECQYQWIMRVDADDILLPQAIEKQIDFIKKNPDVKVAGCLAYHINEKEEIIGLTPLSPKTREEFAELINNKKPIHIQSSGVLMSREVILSVGGYREQFVVAEDFDLWNRLAEKGHMILVQQIPLVLYKIHKDSTTIKHFFKVWKYYKWARECMRKRRCGEAEISLQEFIAMRKKRPWYKRVDTKRKEFGKYSYKKAGFNFANKKFFAFILWIFLSLGINPIYTTKRLYKQRIPLLIKKKTISNNKICQH
jgi:glycosyltransferase involved in cell wall biosynthesis